MGNPPQEPPNRNVNTVHTEASLRPLQLIAPPTLCPNWMYGRKAAAVLCTWVTLSWIVSCLISTLPYHVPAHQYSCFGLPDTGYFREVSTHPTATQQAVLLAELKGIPGCEWYDKKRVSSWFSQRRRRESEREREPGSEGASWLANSTSGLTCLRCRHSSS